MYSKPKQLLESTYRDVQIMLPILRTNVASDTIPERTADRFGLKCFNEKNAAIARGEPIDKTHSSSFLRLHDRATINSSAQLSSFNIKS